jgi:hypothetical protein
MNALSGRMHTEPSIAENPELPPIGEKNPEWLAGLLKLEDLLNRVHVAPTKAVIAPHTETCEFTVTLIPFWLVASTGIERK